MVQEKNRGIRLTWMALFGKFDAGPRLILI